MRVVWSVLFEIFGIASAVILMSLPSLFRFIDPTASVRHVDLIIFGLNADMFLCVALCLYPLLDALYTLAQEGKEE
jgi:hypothetical protein